MSGSRRPPCRVWGTSLVLAAVLAVPGWQHAAPQADRPIEVTLVLGRPTDRSATLNVRASAAAELYCEYGPSGGGANAQTATAFAAPEVPVELVLDGLDPDSSVDYRVRFRPKGSAEPFGVGTQHTFHTQRAPGSAFTFCVQGDSHPERQGKQFDAALYRRTLAAAAADQPDLYFTIGDDFSIDTLRAPTATTVAERYTLQLPFLTIVGASAPLFLVNGNHEQAARYLLDGSPDSPAVWAQCARNLYYPQPAPDGFYTGNTEPVPHIGLLRNTFAWSWGDALFVVIDPYWSSPVAVDSRLDGGPKTTDKWQITLGDEQYSWLKRTLEASGARWKFVFAHHVSGFGRGGVEVAPLYEWGGWNPDGTWGFAERRPAWPLPIHELLVANHVAVFFHGHDHLFARQELDGVIYQELPEPADPTYTLWNADAYTTGDIVGNTGYVRVRVSAASVRVEYVRTYLPQDETTTRHSGEIAFTYTIVADPVPRAPRRRLTRP